MFWNFRLLKKSTEILVMLPIVSYQSVSEALTPMVVCR